MSKLDPVFSPPATKPNVSVMPVPNAWYVACTSKELKRRPLKRVVLGIPVALFRTKSGTAAALIDRCPHRNVPLSLGKVKGENLQCRYHGWEFDAEGTCRLVPGLCQDSDGKARRATAFPVCEQDGLVWIAMDPSSRPPTEPYRIGCLDMPGYTVVRQQLTFPGSLHATVENALDVPHTAFLHSGLFRGTGKTNRIEAVVRRGTDRVEAEFFGEPSPRGLMGRLLAPKGGELQHVDRFILPSIAQVEYRLGDRSHMLVTSFCTPVTDFCTRMFGVVCFRMPIPGWLIRPFVQPVAGRVLKQDAEILGAQTETVQRFGGEQFASTEIDLLGGPIWRLLKEAASDQLVEYSEPQELRRVTLEV